MNALPNVRDIQQTNAVLSATYPPASTGINGGEDYEKIENARRLDPSEYTVNNALGFISSVQPSISMRCSRAHEHLTERIYQVGEFSTDNVKAIRKR